jgi:hypothetical protein
MYKKNQKMNQWTIRGQPIVNSYIGRPLEYHYIMVSWYHASYTFTDVCISVNNTTSYLYQGNKGIKRYWQRIAEVDHSSQICNSKEQMRSGA